ncbi:MAG: hypothetical protein KDJ88_02355 [Bauldia sp.]|nr:hypothetical protein [Bauldia sp.]
MSLRLFSGFSMARLLAAVLALMIVSAGADASLAASCKSSAVTATSGSVLQPTKAKAYDEARFNWVQKVWQKYGPYWHNFANSVKRKTSCSKKPGGWTCTFSAIPCRSHS